MSNAPKSAPTLPPSVMPPGKRALLIVVEDSPDGESLPIAHLKANGAFLTDEIVMILSNVIGDIAYKGMQAQASTVTGLPGERSRIIRVQ